MKYLLIGDPHFNEKNAPVIDEFIEQLYKLNLKKYNKIIILGDILDTHEKINMKSLCKAIDFIEKLSSFSSVYILIGNHDRLNNNDFLSEIHPFTGLKNKKNIYIVDKPYLIEKLLFVPYVKTGRFYEAIENINLDNIEIIFAHQEFYGSIFKDSGDKIPSVKTYSGHIHNYRKIKNLTYVGTPYQHNYYENSDKFILELNIEKDKIKEEKIYLDITKKRVTKIKLSDLLDYKVDTKYNTLLIIDVDKKLLSNKNIQKILDHKNINYRIEKIYNNDIKTKKDSSDNLSFNNLLEEKLEKVDKDIKKLYYKLIKNT